MDSCEYRSLTYLVESVRSEFVIYWKVAVDKLPEGPRRPVAVATALERSLQKDTSPSVH